MCVWQMGWILWEENKIQILMEIAPSIKGFALPHPPSNHTVETPSTNPLLQAATDDGNVILPAEFAWDVRLAKIKLDL